MHKIALSLLGAVALLACDPAEPTLPADNAAADLGALAAWAGCGTGVSTVSLVACDIARDWGKPSTSAEPDEGLVFGACHDVLDGGHAKQTRWMVGEWTADGLRGELRAPVDYEERRRFERVSGEIELGPRATDLQPEREAIATSVSPSAFELVDAKSVRRRGDHTLMIEAHPETSTIRYCRLAPLP